MEPLSATKTDLSLSDDEYFTTVPKKFLQVTDTIPVEYDNCCFMHSAVHVYASICDGSISSTPVFP